MKFPTTKTVTKKTKSRTKTKAEKKKRKVNSCYQDPNKDCITTKKTKKGKNNSFKNTRNEEKESD